MATTVTFLKFIQFKRLGVGKIRAAETIVDHWLSGRPDEATRAAGTRDSVLSRVLQAVFSGCGRDPMTAAMPKNWGVRRRWWSLRPCHRGCVLLEAVVQAAPMLGLLGTVIGMIDAFGTLSLSQGAADPALLAGGIWSALTTTAVGLAVALATFFVANWLESRIEGERQSMEMLISAAIHGRVDTSLPQR